MRLNAKISGDTDYRHKRASGVLLPVFSLPDGRGIGSLGRAAYRFIDLLEAAGQHYWQMLPIGPTGYGNSPYQSFSTRAGNALLIDLDMLCDSRLITADRLMLDWGDKKNEIDYAKVAKSKRQILREIAESFLENPPPDFDNYCEENSDWLEHYALFMAIKDSEGGRAFHDWPDGLRRRLPQALTTATIKLKKSIGYHKMTQYLFDKQWQALHDYARRHSVELIGDLPIYVSPDSVELWLSPALFATDDKGNMTAVAGCPPDRFAPLGQRWGNPVYNWQGMRLGGYSWWVDRLRHELGRFDRLRIDHFRGFESYYCIPVDAADATKGNWRIGPGYELWQTVEQHLGRLPIIAEDLGFITDEVRKLVEQCGFESTRVLQFAFDGDDSEHLPHNIGRRVAIYTGTHDNDTTLGWVENADSKTLTYARRYLGALSDRALPSAMIRTAIASRANTCIIPMQDLLGLGSDGRMNTPGVVGDNWRWRMTSEQLEGGWWQTLAAECQLYGRATLKGDTCK